MVGLEGRGGGGVVPSLVILEEGAEVADVGQLWDGGANTMCAEGEEL